MSGDKARTPDARLLNLLLGLNLALAAVGAAWLLWARRSEPAATAADAPAALPQHPEAVHQSTQQLRHTQAELRGGLASTQALASLAAQTAAQSTLTQRTSNAVAVREPEASELPAPVRPAKRTFDWRDVESPDYRRYIDNLRAVGCPEDKVRQIVLADINELFDRRRLQIAIEADTAWWREAPSPILAHTLAQKGRLLEEQRRSLIGLLLGAEAVEAELARLAPWCHVPLTGPVLGALSADKHAWVQEICGRALERHEALRLGTADPGQAPEAVQAARHREQTRAELRQVLSPEELEEFLLRSSHVAHNLRYELAALNPTEAEFRQVFRAVDPLEHQMQLEFGSLEAMSPEQRERFQRQRQQAIREALGPARFQDYLLAQDPAYQAALALARARNAPPEAVRPIYQLARAIQARRQQVLADPNLSPEQRDQALKAIDREQAESLQRILTGGTFAR